MADLEECRSALTRAVWEVSSLREQVRIRDEFLAIVAHDLRSPLASIDMSAETLMGERAISDSPTLQR